MSLRIYFSDGVQYMIKSSITLTLKGPAVDILTYHEEALEVYKLQFEANSKAL